MKSSIVLVSNPDDFLEDGFRILLVDLDKNQSEIVSQSLLSLITDEKIIVYTWNQSDDMAWLFDKQAKAQLVLFNAESQFQDLVGYFSSKNHGYYFGHLRSLKYVNKSAVHDVEELKEILIERIGIYGQTKR
jgi:hypothetical protein